jgi:hypothetical protein
LGLLAYIVHFFSSVAHVWVPGAKTTGLIAKMFVFSEIKFFRKREISSFGTCFAEILVNIGSLLFISWAISMKLSDYNFFMPIYRCAKFR